MDRHAVARLLVVPVVFIVCAAAVGCSQGGGSAATPGMNANETSDTVKGPSPTGQLALELTEGLGQYNGLGTIWLVNTDGTGLHQIASCPQGYRIEHPAWSPDGKKIAYHSGVYHWGTGWLPTHSVWVMDSDGKSRTQLTHLDAGCLWPSWSPDGATIAFGAYSGINHEGHIALMRADGSNVTTITAGKFEDAFPEFAPDGRIVFLRKPFANPKAPGDLYVVNADGTGLAQITHSQSVGCFALSPDGSRIAYHDTVSSQLKIMRTDGSGPSTVLVDGDFGWIFVAMTWSPDGRAIAIGCSGLEASSGDQIYTVNSDGSGLCAIPGINAGLDPAWRPK